MENKNYCETMKETTIKKGELVFCSGAKIDFTLIRDEGLYNASFSDDISENYKYIKQLISNGIFEEMGDKVYKVNEDLKCMIGRCNNEHGIKYYSNHGVTEMFSKDFFKKYI